MDLQARSMSNGVGFLCRHQSTNTNNHKNRQPEDGLFAVLMSDPRVVAGGMICFCILIIILQEVAVFFLLSPSNDSDNQDRVYYSVIIIEQSSFNDSSTTNIVSYVYSRCCNTTTHR
jgi:hypothetical protein